MSPPVFDRLYVLDGKRPVPATLREWGRWMETADRHVGDTEVAPGVRVSTVFLGVDHNHSGRGPPVLFETLVFDDYGSGGEQHRYHTWDKAETGHRETVDRLRAKITNSQGA